LDANNLVMVHWKDWDRYYLKCMAKKTSISTTALLDSIGYWKWKQSVSQSAI